ncbi:hypothetical protein R1sor_015517 [Riccia sorocarpa]|uniref:DUF676 domain-containing protein n=1 Tax=Riccia sorocarpa TaxID=122646 RepID=A0ABD3HCF9_9MARC
MTNSEQTSSVEMNRIDKTEDLERMGVKKLNDNLYDLSSNTCEEGRENAVVIFFHGLELDDRANAEDTWLRTWTYRDESNSSPMSAECWPAQMFSNDEDLEDDNVVIRAYAAKYDANKYKTNDKGRLDIYLFAENLVQTLIGAVMKKIKGQIPIFLVAHSYGGIVIQELIEHAFTKARRNSDAYSKRFLQCLAGIFFYAVPHGSLEQDTYNNIFRHERQTHEQQTLAEPGEMLSLFNKELIRSREKFKKTIVSIVGDPEKPNGLRNGAEIRIKSVFESHVTDLGHWKGIIVQEAAMDVGQQDELVIEADHFKICKPSPGQEGFTENRYQYLRDLILEVVNEAENH